MKKKIKNQKKSSRHPMVRDTVQRIIGRPRESFRRMTKINLIIDFSRRRISEIKLKRTDTTLDLSQKGKES